VADSARSGIDRVAVLLGSFGMTGFFPIAPATVASAVTAAVLVFVYPLHSVLAYALLCAAIFVVGVWSAGRLERLYGLDPSAAVIDEVLGMALTLAGVPITPVTLLFGFLFFRVLDVVKLPPGRALERLPGGWGIMADDACAGIYAAVLLRVLLRVWPGLRLAWWMLVPLAGAALVLLVFRKPLWAKYGKKRCDPRLGMQGGPRA
jgi:phosphatidylglycerophosphatase A